MWLKIKTTLLVLSLSYQTSNHTPSRKIYTPIIIYTLKKKIHTHNINLEFEYNTCEGNAVFADF
jgi:hypothetical protein